MYGIRQTPFRAVLETSLAFSALKSNASARKPESAILESMSSSVDPRSSRVKGCWEVKRLCRLQVSLISRVVVE